MLSQFWLFTPSLPEPFYVLFVCLFLAFFFVFVFASFKLRKNKNIRTSNID